MSMFVKDPKHDAARDLAMLMMKFEIVTIHDALDTMHLVNEMFPIYVQAIRPVDFIKAGFEVVYSTDCKTTV